MKMRYLYILIGLLMFSAVEAQISRGELEKQTSKGIELLKTGKVEDAVAVFNEILSKDPTEGKALLLRARAKYELSAYKGAKKDCFAYMDLYGIDDEVAGLLGKTEKALENYKQALAYLRVAIEFDADGIEYLLDRADIYYNLGLDEQACVDWHQAKLNGSEEARDLSARHCKRVRVPIDEVRTEGKPGTREVDEDDVVEEANEDDTSNEDEEEEMEEDVPEEVEEEGNVDDVPEVVEEEDEDYPVDNKVKEIFVDEELTILVAEGIGSRKMIDMPDILILSDKSGEVVVDVCIDRLGRIGKATLNEEKSTLKTPSLVSLALRESANFRFARSSRKSHCGTITFIITGSE